MSFQQATVLCLSKCFYRDTPQAVDLDQSYSGCVLSHMFFCLLIAVFLTHNDKPVLEALIYFKNALELQYTTFHLEAGTVLRQEQC